MKAMKVKASLKNYRGSAQKVREVVDIIRGVMLNEAEIILSGVKKDSAVDILKLIKSASANAENNFKLNKKDLFISEIKVNEGVVMKRWMARAHGSAARILKRSCQIDVVVEPIAVKKESAKIEKNEEKVLDKKKVKKTAKKAIIKNSK